MVWQGKRRGEIDIIAKKKDVYHFIEVKTSAKEEEGFYPEERAHRQKLQKIFRTAMYWLLSHKRPLEGTRWQIDIIGITLEPFQIRHWENVFEDKGL